MRQRVGILCGECGFRSWMKPAIVAVILNALFLIHPTVFIPHRSKIPSFPIFGILARADRSGLQPPKNGAVLRIRLKWNESRPDIQ
jgi:hypothetical protein